MTRPPAGEADSLAPLTAALRDRARAAADEVLARADEDARESLDRAHQEAAAMLAQARAKGAADGAAVLAAERAGAARQARAILLAAQQAAHDDLRTAAREAVRALREDPDYPVMLEALRARAQVDLGPGAVVTTLDGGGIVAESGPRRIEYSLAALADDLVDEVVDRAEPWSP
jgi:vacuolar-type H+-ATPase subunit E/Vma4